jgi:hypothetical protein
MWLLLLVAVAQARAWCGCAGSVTGNFAAVLALQSVSNVTVMIGDTVSSSSAAVFARAADPQALVMHLASDYTGGQAIAASQLQTRCIRYTRGGFQLMATTGLVVAARNGSILTWLHVELDLFAACSSARETNVFRVARPSIRVLPVNLMDLETQADPTGPLVDDTETVCRPRSSPWFGRDVSAFETGNGQAGWRMVRTVGDLIYSAQVCGPAADDPIEGVYFARAPTRRYVQVCAYDDAVFCAADAMLMNSVPRTPEELQEMFTSPEFTVTRKNHLIQLYDSLVGAVNRFVIDVNIGGRNRQISSFLQLVLDPESYSFSDDQPNAAELLHGLNGSTNTLISQSPGQDNFISDDDDVGATECKMSNAMHGHSCDPLVRADRSVQFGDDPANDTYIAAGASLPCLPSITAACPAIQLPPPVFSGATTAGIVVGSVTCALIIAMIASTAAEHCTSKSATLAPVLPVVAPKPVAKPQALPPPPQAKPPPPPAKPSKPAAVAPVDLDMFWARTGLKFNKINKKKM